MKHSNYLEDRIRILRNCIASKGGICKPCLAEWGELDDLLERGMSDADRRVFAARERERLARRREREACARIALGYHAKDGRPESVPVRIAAAIRARQKS